MAHVAKWKYGEVEELTKIITENPIIGIADINSIPAPQLQKMRENIRGKAIVRCSKNSLIKIALDNANKKCSGIEGLEGHIDGQSVIIATDMNPFKLFKVLKGTKTMAPAKGGEIAPNDIIVKAGDTPFKPGPIVGELQSAGIPAAIQQGKVVIKSNKTIVKAGEKIPTASAQMLTRLEIFPLEIGMNLHAVFENGDVFLPDVLDIDTDAFMAQMALASSNAFNLAVQIGWTTKDTINTILMKAVRDARAVALEAGVVNKETINDIIAKANASMLSVASKVKDDALDDDLKKKL